MKLTTKLALAVLALPALMSSGCDGQSTTDRTQAAKTEEMLAEADRQVGMPNIMNFTERKLAKMILELRDTEGLRTWTYIVDMHGELHFLTESIGYGLPYSVQFTNPERLSWSSTQGGALALPQADPNGLFMPSGLSATWIIAATAEGPKPMYVEPEILVSPFPIAGVPATR